MHNQKKQNWLSIIRTQFETSFAKNISHDVIFTSLFFPLSPVRRKILSEHGAGPARKNES